MATNLLLDDRLIAKAVKSGKHRTKCKAVNTALAYYIRRKKQMRILDLEGTIDFRPDWDHKADRRRDLKRMIKD